MMLRLSVTTRDMKLYGKILPKETPFWTKEHIEIVDSIPTDPEEFRDAYKHNIVTLDIVGDRGVIDEYARHRVCGISIESTRYVNYSNNGCTFVFPYWYEKLKEDLAREMVFEPERLVNLNGAKETELKFGDQFKGR